MSELLDERVVEMRFDNSNFEHNVNQSINTINKLKDSLDFEDAGESFKNISAAAASCDLSPMEKSVEQISVKFNMLEMIAINVMSNIANKVADAGMNMVKNLTLDQVTAGWSKYEQKTQSVQTIMAATGRSIDDVNDRLERLIWFADETSYSFVDMVNNIGKFTSAGVDLDDAVNSMMGISNWAALSGAGIQQASRAMFNLSQAMGMGYVGIADWRSIELANMATVEFKQTVIDTALQLGTLRQEADGTITTLDGKAVVTAFNMRETLKKGWFTGDVLTTALNQYSEFANKVYNIQKQYNIDTASEAIELMESMGEDLGTLSAQAFIKAQEAISFTQAIDSVRDAVSSQWMKTFEMIFGNYEQAKKLWTQLANDLWDIFASSGERRNTMLSEILDSNYQKLARELPDRLEFNETLYEKLYNITKSNMGENYANALFSQYQNIEDLLKNTTVFGSTIKNAFGLIIKDYDKEFDQLTLLSKNLQNNTISLRQAAIRMANNIYGSDEETITKNIEQLGFNYEELAEFAEIWKALGDEYDWTAAQKEFEQILEKRIETVSSFRGQLREYLNADEIFESFSEWGGRDKFIAGFQNIFSLVKNLYNFTSEVADGLAHLLGRESFLTFMIDGFYDLSQVFGTAGLFFEKFTDPIYDFFHGGIQKRFDKFLHGYEIWVDESKTLDSGIVVGAYEHVPGVIEQITEFYKTNVQTLPEETRKAIDEITGNVTEFFNKIPEKFTELKENIIGTKKTLIDTFDDGSYKKTVIFEGGLINEWKESVSSFADGLIPKALTGVTNFLEKISGFLFGYKNDTKEFEGAISWVYNRVMDFIGMLKTIGKSIKDIFRTVFEDVKTFFTGGKYSFSDATIWSFPDRLKKHFEDLKNTPAYQDVKRFFFGGKDAEGNDIPNFFEKISKVVNNFTSSKAFRDAKRFLFGEDTSLTTKGGIELDFHIPGIFEKIGNSISEIIKSVPYQEIKKFILGDFESGKPSIFGKIQNAISSVTGSSAFNDLKTFFIGGKYSFSDATIAPIFERISIKIQNLRERLSELKESFLSLIPESVLKTLKNIFDGGYFDSEPVSLKTFLLGDKDTFSYLEFQLERIKNTDWFKNIKDFLFGKEDNKAQNGALNSFFRFFHTAEEYEKANVFGKIKLALQDLQIYLFGWQENVDGTGHKIEGLLTPIINKVKEVLKWFGLFWEKEESEDGTSKWVRIHGAIDNVKQTIESFVNSKAFRDIKTFLFGGKDAEGNDIPNLFGKIKKSFDEFLHGKEIEGLDGKTMGLVDKIQSRVVNLWSIIKPKLVDLKNTLHEFRRALGLDWEIQLIDENGIPTEKMVRVPGFIDKIGARLQKIRETDWFGKINDFFLGKEISRTWKLDKVTGKYFEEIQRETSGLSKVKDSIIDFLLGPINAEGKRTENLITRLPGYLKDLKDKAEDFVLGKYVFKGTEWNPELRKYEGIYEREGSIIDRLKAKFEELKEAHPWFATFCEYIEKIANDISKLFSEAGGSISIALGNLNAYFNGGTIKSFSKNELGDIVESTKEVNGVINDVRENIEKLFNGGKEKNKSEGFLGVIRDLLGLDKFSIFDKINSVVHSIIGINLALTSLNFSLGDKLGFSIQSGLEILVDSIKELAISAAIIAAVLGGLALEIHFLGENGYKTLHEAVFMLVGIFGLLTTFGLAFNYIKLDPKTAISLHLFSNALSTMAIVFGALLFVFTKYDISFSNEYFQTAAAVIGGFILLLTFFAHASVRVAKSGQQIQSASGVFLGIGATFYAFGRMISTIVLSLLGLYLLTKDMKDLSDFKNAAIILGGAITAAIASLFLISYAIKSINKAGGGLSAGSFLTTATIFIGFSSFLNQFLLLLGGLVFVIENFDISDKTLAVAFGILAGAMVVTAGFIGGLAFILNKTAESIMKLDKDNKYSKIKDVMKTLLPFIIVVGLFMHDMLKSISMLAGVGKIAGWENLAVSFAGVVTVMLALAGVAKIISTIDAKKFDSKNVWKFIGLSTGLMFVIGALTALMAFISASIPGIENVQFNILPLIAAMGEVAALMFAISTFIDYFKNIKINNYKSLEKNGLALLVAFAGILSVTLLLNVMVQNMHALKNGDIHKKIFPLLVAITEVTFVAFLVTNLLDSMRTVYADRSTVDKFGAVCIALIGLAGVAALLYYGMNETKINGDISSRLFPLMIAIVEIAAVMSLLGPALWVINKTVSANNFKDFAKLGGKLVLVTAALIVIAGAAALLAAGIKKFKLNESSFDNLFTLLKAVTLITADLLIISVALAVLEHVNFSWGIAGKFAGALAALLIITAALIPLSKIAQKVDVSLFTVLSDILLSIIKITGTLTLLSAVFWALSSLKINIDFKKVWSVFLKTISALTPILLGMIAFMGVITLINTLKKDSNFVQNAVNSMASILDTILLAIIKIVGFAIGLTVIFKLVEVLSPFLSFNPAVVSAVLGKVLTVIGIIFGVVIAIAAVTAVIDHFAGEGTVLNAITNAIELIKTITKGLGEAIGSFAGGIGKGVADSLPGIADSLAAFMEHLKPFLEELRNLTVSDLVSIVILKSIMEGIFAAEFLGTLSLGLEKLQGEGGMISVAEHLQTFAEKLKGFVESIRDFTVSDVISAGLLVAIMTAAFTTEALADLAMLAQKLGEGGDFQKVADGLADIVTKIKPFIEAAREITPEDVTAVGNITAVMLGAFTDQVLADLILLAEKLKPGGDINTVIENLSALPEKLKTYTEAAKAITPDDIENTNNLTKVLLNAFTDEVLAGLTALAGRLASGGEIDTVITNLTALPEKLKTYTEAAKAIAPDDIDSTNNITKVMLEVLASEALDTVISLASKIAPNSTIDKAITDLVTLVGKLKTDFLPNITGLDDDAVKSAGYIPKVLNAVFTSSLLTLGTKVTNWLTGSTNYVELFSKLTEENGVLDGIKVFADKCEELANSGMVLDNVSAAADAVISVFNLISMMGKIGDIKNDTQWYDKLAFWKDSVSLKTVTDSLTQVTEHILPEIKNLQNGLINNGIDAELIKNTIGVYVDLLNTVMNFGSIEGTALDITKFQNIGEYVVEGLVLSIGSQDSNDRVYQVAYKLGESLLQGLQAGTQVNSPSKAAIKIGQFVTQGLTIGLLNGQPLAESMARELGEGTIKALLDGALKYDQYGLSQHAINMVTSDLLDENIFNMPDFSTTNHYGMEDIDFEGMRSFLQEKLGDVLDPTMIDGFVNSYMHEWNQMPKEILDEGYAQLMKDIAKGEYGLGQDAIVDALEAELGSVEAANQAWKDYNDVLEGNIKINQKLGKEKKQNPPMTYEEYMEMIQHDQEGIDLAKNGFFQQLAAANGTTWMEEAEKLGYNSKITQQALDAIYMSSEEFYKTYDKMIAQREKEAAEDLALREEQLDLNHLAADSSTSGSKIEIIDDTGTRQTINAVEEETEVLKELTEAAEDASVAVDELNEAPAPKTKADIIDETNKSIEEAKTNMEQLIGLDEVAAKRIGALNGKELDKIFTKVQNGAEITEAELKMLHDFRESALTYGDFGQMNDVRKSNFGKIGITEKNQEAAINYLALYDDWIRIMQETAKTQQTVEQKAAQTTEAATQSADTFENSWASSLTGVGKDLYDFFDKGIRDAVDSGSNKIEFSAEEIAKTIGANVEDITEFIGEKMVITADKFGFKDFKKAIKDLGTNPVISTLFEGLGVNFDVTMSGNSGDIVNEILSNPKQAFGSLVKFLKGDVAGALVDVLDLFSQVKDDTKTANETEIVSKVDTSQLAAADLYIQQILDKYKLTAEEEHAAKTGWVSLQNGDFISKAQQAALEKLWQGMVTGSYGSINEAIKSVYESMGIQFEALNTYFDQGGHSLLGDYATDALVYARKIKDSKELGVDYTIKDVVSDINKGLYGEGIVRKKAIEALGYDYKKVQGVVNDYTKIGEAAFKDLPDDYAHLTDAELEAMKQKERLDTALATTPEGAFKSVGDFLEGVSKVIADDSAAQNFIDFMTKITNSMKTVNLDNAPAFEQIGNFLKMVKQTGAGSNTLPEEFGTAISAIAESINSVELHTDQFQPITDFLTEANKLAQTASASITDFVNALNELKGANPGKIDIPTPKPNKSAPVVNKFTGNTQSEPKNNGKDISAYAGIDKSWINNQTASLEELTNAEIEAAAQKQNLDIVFASTPEASLEPIITFLSEVAEVSENTTDIIAPFSNLVKDMISMPTSELSDKAIEAAGIIVEAMIMSFESYYPKFTEIGQNFVIQLVNGVISKKGVAAEAAASLASSMLVSFQEQAVNKAAEFGKDFTTAIASSLSTEESKAILKDGFNALFGMPAESAMGMTGAGMGMGFGFGTGESSVSSLGATFGQSFATDFVQGFSEQVSGQSELLKANMAPIFNNLMSVTDTFQQMQNPGEVITNFVTDVGSAAEESMDSEAMENITVLSDELNELFRNAVPEGYDLGFNFVQGLRDGLLAGRDAFIDEIRAIAAEIGAAASVSLGSVIQIGSPSRLTMRYGGYFVEGFKIGLENNASSVYNAAHTVGEASLDGFDDALDMHSPSKELIERGELFDESTGMGIVDKMSVVKSAAAGMANAAVEAVDNTFKNAPTAGLDSYADAMRNKAESIKLANATQRALKENTKLILASTDPYADEMRKRAIVNFGNEFKEAANDLTNTQKITENAAKSLYDVWNDMMLGKYGVVGTEFIDEFGVKYADRNDYLVKNFGLTWNDLYEQSNGKGQLDLTKLTTGMTVSELNYEAERSKKTLKDIVYDIYNGFYGVGQTRKDALGENYKFLQGLVNRLGNGETIDWTQAEKDANSNAVDIGENTVDGISKGVSTKIREVTDAGVKIVSALTGKVTEELLIASPSKLFMKFGEYIDRGLAIGIKDNTALVTDNISDLSDILTSTFNETTMNLADMVTSEMNTEPVIRPVIDMSDVAKSAKSIDTMLSHEQAVKISTSENQKNIQNGYDPIAQSPATYSFVQNNYSPKSLSRAEIYRQTKNQFAQLKMLKQ